MENKTASGNISTLNVLDFTIIALYFVAVVSVGIWASWKSNRSTLQGYFLAARGVWWLPVGASLFGSNLGSEHFIGLAGYGAANGIAVTAFEFNALFTILLLGWIFLPVYLSSGVFTMPEYIQKRFGGQRLRVYLAVLALLLSILTKISVNMFAGALFIQQALGWNIYLSILTLLLITGLYTLVGGLTAVIYTDTIQTFIMIGGAFVLMILSFSKISWSELPLYYQGAIAETVLNSSSSCGRPRADAFHIFRDPLHSDLPWPGAIFGITISATWYLCADQVIVQRALAAKSLAHAKGACVFYALLKILPLFLMIFPGMISRVLFPNEIACATASECLRYCGSEVGCSNTAYPKLVLEIMPSGLKGLMLAAVMSGLMSSLTSIFNSSSTIFTIDIWRRIRPKASDAELLVVGRLFVIFMVIVSIVWMPIIQASEGGRLFDYIQSITSYLAPPICAVFVLAVLWGRINEKGAFWGMMLGLLIGVIKMVTQFIFPAPSCGEKDTRPNISFDMHYLYFGVLLFTVVTIFAIAVSLLTEPLDEKHLLGLTFATRFQRPKEYEIAEPVDINNGNQDAQSEVSSFHKILNWFCGTGKDDQQESTPVVIIDITETRIQKILLNIAAVICMLLGVFVFAFFG